MADRSPSPPTRRVVEVVEMLAGADRPMGVGEIAAALGIARATATALLRELADASWVTRDADRRYAVGPALAGIGGRLALPGSVADRLDALATLVGCGVTLSRIGVGALTVVAKAHGGDRDIPGVPVGQRVPLAYPAGAAVMPWRDDVERAGWVAGADDREAAEQLLALAEQRRHVVFRPTSEDAGLVDVLADLLDVVGGDLLRPRLRTKVLMQLSALTARAYTAAELDDDASLPVSYLAAPIVVGGRAVHELQMGPLRSAVTREERNGYIDALTSAAADLSRDPGVGAARAGGSDQADG